MLQHVAVCCKVLQSEVAVCVQVAVWRSVAVYCSVVQCGAVWRSAVQCVAVCWRVLKCVAVCCSCNVLQGKECAEGFQSVCSAGQLCVSHI